MGTARNLINQGAFGSGLGRGMLPPETREEGTLSTLPGTTPTDFDRELKKALDLQRQISGFRS